MSDHTDLAAAGLVIILLAAAMLIFTSELLGAKPAVAPYRPPLTTYLWTYRGIDILVQGFLIFATATAVATLFRVEKGPGAVEEGVEESTEASGGS
jgi:ABC-type amino acid transport system permease subunit